MILDMGEIIVGQHRLSRKNSPWFEQEFTPWFEQSVSVV